jgi:hypothetical protein
MGKLKKHKLSSQPAYKGEAKKKFFTKEKIWTVILGGIMIFSVFGIMLGTDSNVQERKEYKEYKFDKVVIGNQYAWQTEIADKTYTFDYYPTDLEEVNFTADVNSMIKGMKSAYVTFNPNTKKVDQFELARFKLIEAGFKEYEIYFMNGITAPNAAYNQPIVDCGNATAYVPVIKMTLSNTTSASMEGNCLVIEATEYSIIAMKDRILYAMAGIIQ